MSQDVIEDKYARLYEIPNQLSNRNCHITCICLSYHTASDGTVVDKPSIKWLSYNFFPSFGLKYLLNVYRQIRNFKPDAIMASSDVLHIILGYWVSKICRGSFYADLYDNYEAFGMSKIPLMKTLYRHALSRANHIFTVSNALRSKISKFKNNENITTVVSTIDPEKFHVLNPEYARDKIGIGKANNEIMIGLSGSIDRSRGIEYLFQAFSQLRNTLPNVTLYLAKMVADAALWPHILRFHR